MKSSDSGCAWLWVSLPLFLSLLIGGCAGASSETVVPPPAPTFPMISSFSASPTSITPGQTSTLSWQVSGETSLTLSGTTIATTSSSIVEMPAETTIYTLAATNSAGTVQQSVTVTVMAATDIASVQINPEATSQVIPPSFLGIAHDLGQVPAVIGTSSSNMNPIYEQLWKNILQYGNGPLMIRGLADDNSSNFFESSSLSALSQLNTDIGAQFFIGVDLEDDDLSTAATEATLLAVALPGNKLQALELGNEPDEYESSYSAYLTQYQQFAPTVIAASGGVKLAAPVLTGGIASFMNNLNSFVTTQASTLSIVDVHHYPGSACNGATEPPDYLLKEDAVDGDDEPLSGPVGIVAYVPTAQKAGIPLRIGELNSIDCQGQPGVSNSFSSALWGMDISFSYADAGVGGVNFFAPGSTNVTHPYTPFDFTNVINADGTITYGVRDINPLYYGMLMFAQAVQNSAKLLPVSLTTSANIKAWATIDANHTIRLLILNKDLTASGPVSMSLAGYGQAAVTRLIAPSFSAITGVTLAGQTFDGSPDGKPQGIATSELAQPANGIYTIVVPSVSAALVTIQQ